jgi:hypothetical protein
MTRIHPDKARKGSTGTSALIRVIRGRISFLFWLPLKAALRVTCVSWSNSFFRLMAVWLTAVPGFALDKCDEFYYTK